MTKIQKAVLIICLTFAALFFAIYAFLGKITDGKPETIEYPQSSLTADLFDSQNTTYTYTSALPIPYTFKTVPYDIDLIDGRFAEINNGHFVNVNENINFYVSEFPKGGNPHETVLSEYANVIYLNFSKESSYIQTAASEVGYINGYLANYFIDRLLISTGTNISAQSAYVIGYVVDPGDEYENNIIVSIATTQESTQNLADCKTYVDAMIGTLRLDEAVKETREREARRREEANVATNDNYISAGYENNTSMNVATNGEVAVSVEKDFSDMSVLVTWTEPCEEADVSFCNSNGISVGTIVTSTPTQAVIEVGQCAKGLYYIKHSDMYDVGTINFKITGN